MSILFVVVIISFVFLLGFLPFIFLIFLSKTSKKTNVNERSNVLLVIAHPDDECLFFSPTILSSNARFYLLCLSNGGNIRSDELLRSCRKLQIEDFQIINDEIHLKDSQEVFWTAEAILGHVEKSIRRWNISEIISFDSFGVSGHRNHSSIYFALLQLQSKRNSIKFFALISKPIYRKYLTIVEFLHWIFFSTAKQRKIHFLPLNQCLTPHRAMFEHRSQFVWFRILYLFFSQYIWINEFEEIF